MGLLEQLKRISSCTHEDQKQTKLVKEQNEAQLILRKLSPAYFKNLAGQGKTQAQVMNDIEVFSDYENFSPPAQGVAKIVSENLARQGFAVYVKAEQCYQGRDRDPFIRYHLVASW